LIIISPENLIFNRKKPVYLHSPGRGHSGRSRPGFNASRLSTSRLGGSNLIRD
jgi:hypothetical protein